MHRRQIFRYLILGIDKMKKEGEGYSLLPVDK
jgi:hypothetical protein